MAFWTCRETRSSAPHARDYGEYMTVVQGRYSASSVYDIIEVAGVPEGSFTNRFASKEAFGLELVNIYYKNIERFNGGDASQRCATTAEASAPLG